MFGKSCLLVNRWLKRIYYCSFFSDEVRPRGPSFPRLVMIERATWHADIRCGLAKSLFRCPPNAARLESRHNTRAAGWAVRAGSFPAK